MTRLEALEQCLDAVMSGTEERIIHHGAFCLDDAVLDLAYAGSLDAAKALHDAELPDIYPVIDFASGEVTIYDKVLDDECGYGFQVQSISIARAWLIAILFALIARESDK